MSQAAKTLQSLQHGDIVKIERTLKFEGVDLEGDYCFHDVAHVQGGPIYTLEPKGSLKVEMVKRARRRPPQRQDFEEGQVISGKTVKQVMWRRGTILSHFDNQRGQWVLLGSGKWQSLDDPHAFDFSDFADAIQYRIVSLP